jgi:hypothetical protein
MRARGADKMHGLAAISACDALEFPIHRLRSKHFNNK